MFASTTMPGPSAVLTRLTVPVIACLIIPAALHPAIAQDSDVVQQVKQLVRQLDDDNKAKRDEAVEAIAKIGAKALPHLPSLDSKALSAEQIDRLRKLVVRLWRQKLNDQVAGSKIQLDKPPKLLKDLLADIQKQSGNVLYDMREKLNLEIDDPDFAPTKKSLTFWETLDQINDQLKLEYYLHGEESQIGFTTRMRKGGDVVYNGAFRFELERIYIERRFDLRTSVHQMVVQFKMMHEPKLQPVMMDIDAPKQICEDDKSRKCASTDEAAQKIPITSETCQMPLLFKFEAPKRDAVSIKQITLDLVIWMPANSEQVVFDNLKSDKNQIQSTAGLRVDFKKMEVEDTTWKAVIEVEQLTDEQVSESFVQAIIRNDVWLQKKDGTVFKVNGGKQQYLSEPKKWGAECIFVDAPGKPEDYKLVVRSPTGITPIPIKATFKNLMLP